MRRKIFIVIIAIMTICSSVYCTYAAETIDDIITGADDFINSGGGATKFNVEMLQEVIDVLYNIALGFGMIIAVIVGIVLGIQFMTSGNEEKAKVKESLWVYVVGCVIIFGAFGIWKLAITIIS